MAFWTDIAENTRDPKRNFRFLLTVPGINEAWAVKKTDKPGWEIGETSHTFLNHTFYYPTKVTWKEITVTLVDPIHPYDTTLGVMQWLQTAGYRIPNRPMTNTPYSITKSKAVFNNKKHKYGVPAGGAKGAGGNFVIKQIDGEGNSIEEWTLYNAWIKTATWTNLDYDSEDMSTVDLSVRYDFANYEHKMSTKKAQFHNSGVKINENVIQGNPEK